MKDKRKDAFGVLNGEFRGGVARRGRGLRASSDFATASQKLRTRIGFLVKCGHRTHPFGWVAGSGSQALLSFLRSPASRTARRHRRKGARKPATGWRSEHAPTGHDELMAALPITHDWSELFGKDRRQRRQVSGGVVGDAKEGADCVLIPRLGIDCTSTQTLADSHANPALFRKAARRRRRRLLLSVDAPAGSDASEFVKRRRPVGVHCPKRWRRAIRGLMTLALRSIAADTTQGSPIPTDHTRLPKRGYYCATRSSV